MATWHDPPNETKPLLPPKKPVDLKQPGKPPEPTFDQPKNVLTEGAVYSSIESEQR